MPWNNPNGFKGCLAIAYVCDDVELRPEFAEFGFELGTKDGLVFGDDRGNCHRLFSLHCELAHYEATSVLLQSDWYLRE